MDDYDKAIEINHKDASFYNNRGLLHRKLSHYEKAEKDFGMALSIVPEHPNYLFSLAKNCQENGNKDKARSSLEKGIKSFEKENDQNLSDHFGI